MKRNAANLKKYRAVCAEIWSERPHKCVDCDTQIGNWNIEMGENVPSWWNFAHGKNGRRSEKDCLDKKNISLKCFACHSNSDHGLKEKSTWLK